MAGFKESFTKGFTTLNVKANNFVEESKCKTYISTLEGEIQRIKAAIGETVFNNWKQEKELSEGLEGFLEEIAKREQAIQEQEEKIKQLALEEQQILGTQNEAGPAAQGTIYCGQCGAPNAVAYKFCCKCGVPLRND